jgi:hypothetical protein
MIKFDNIFKLSMISTAIATLVACGGGGSTNTASNTQTGSFVDAPVEGLQYQTGNITGVTGPGGSFQYIPGQNVTFSIGNVVLGTATPVTNNATLMPMDLVANTSDVSNPNVILIAQTLQAFNSNSNANGSIIIPTNITTSLQNTAIMDGSGVINLSTLNITANTSLVSTLPVSAKNLIINSNITPSMAIANMIPFVYQQFAGVWNGSLTGGTSGSCNITIGQPTLGNLSSQVSTSSSAPVNSSGSTTTLSQNNNCTQFLTPFKSGTDNNGNSIYTVPSSQATALSTMGSCDILNNATLIIDSNTSSNSSSGVNPLFGSGNISIDPNACPNITTSGCLVVGTSATIQTAANLNITLISGATSTTPTNNLSINIAGSCNTGSNTNVTLNSFSSLQPNGIFSSSLSNGMTLNGTFARTGTFTGTLTNANGTSTANLVLTRQ